MQRVQLQKVQRGTVKSHREKETKAQHKSHRRPQTKLEASNSPFACFPPASTTMCSISSRGKLKKKLFLAERGEEILRQTFSVSRYLLQGKSGRTKRETKRGTLLGALGALIKTVALRHRLILYPPMEWHHLLYSSLLPGASDHSTGLLRLLQIHRRVSRLLKAHLRLSFSFIKPPFQSCGNKPMKEAPMTEIRKEDPVTSSHPASMPKHSPNCLQRYRRSSWWNGRAGNRFPNCVSR